MTAAEALAHPTWSMGEKITIDSATLMNKGLEVIEAHHLFGIAYDAVEVVVHPQSIVHGMVRFRDGALLAHAGLPDMRVPISWALTHPHRASDDGRSRSTSPRRSAWTSSRPTSRPSAASPSPARRAWPAAPRRAS